MDNDKAGAAAANNKMSPKEAEAVLNARLGDAVTVKVEACTPDMYRDFLARMMSEPEEGVEQGQIAVWTRDDVTAKKDAGGAAGATDAADGLGSGAPSATVRPEDDPLWVD